MAFYKTIAIIAGVILFICGFCFGGDMKDNVDRPLGSNLVVFTTVDMEPLTKALVAAYQKDIDGRPKVWFTGSAASTNLLTTDFSQISIEVVSMDEMMTLLLENKAECGFGQRDYHFLERSKFYARRTWAPIEKKVGSNDKGDIWMLIDSDKDQKNRWYNGDLSFYRFVLSDKGQHVVESVNQISGALDDGMRFHALKYEDRPSKN